MHPPLETAGDFGALFTVNVQVRHGAWETWG